MIRVSVAGRRRYYRLADPAVAEVLKGVEGLAGSLARRRPEPLAWDQATLHARCCLDHLAGRLGAQVASGALDKGLIRLVPSGPRLTGEGERWLESLGVELESVRREPRRFLRLCQDWLDDSTHIGGAVGALMLRAFVRQGWLRRAPRSPKVAITPGGVSAFRRHLGLELRQLDGRSG